MDVTDVEEDTIRRLCREVSDELEALTERAVQQIRSELPAYSAVPVAEQGNYIRKQLSAMLCAVAENETITTEDTDRNRELGRRRAMQGLPLSDVIETYHIASRELWDTMVQRSTKPTHELLQAGGKLWDLVHAATSAVAVGHSEATRSEQAIRAGVRYRFFETLHSATDMELSNARELAQTLGFDTQKSFQALSAVEDEWSEAQVEHLQRTLDSVHVVAHCSRHGSRVIVMCQGEPTEVIHAIMRDHPRTSLGRARRRSSKHHRRRAHIAVGDSAGHDGQFCRRMAHRHSCHPPGRAAAASTGRGICGRRALTSDGRRPRLRAKRVLCQRRRP